MCLKIKHGLAGVCRHVEHVPDGQRRYWGQRIGEMVFCISENKEWVAYNEETCPLKPKWVFMKSYVVCVAEMWVPCDDCISLDIKMFKPLGVYSDLKDVDLTELWEEKPLSLRRNCEIRSEIMDAICETHWEMKWAHRDKDAGKPTEKSVSTVSQSVKDWQYDQRTNTEHAQYDQGEGELAGSEPYSDTEAVPDDARHFPPGHQEFLQREEFDWQNRGQGQYTQLNMNEGYHGSTGAGGKAGSDP